MTDLKSYYAEARSWDQDRLIGAYRSRRLAWIIAAIASSLAIIAVGAVAILVPLRTVEPFVITVDRSTGATAVTTALSGDSRIPYTEAVSKYFIAQYVRAREGWVPAAARENFEAVAILSEPDEQGRWQATFDSHSPNSPQTLFGPHASVDIAIRAIAFVNARVAQVRFQRTVRPDVGDIVTTNWIATISFGFTRAPMAERDRLRNPLGFQVATYRADPEVGP